MRLVPTSVLIVTSMLVATVLLGGFGAPLWLVQAAIFSGVCLVVWMVLGVLKELRPPVRRLEPGEDWGYQDRPDLRPSDSRRRQSGTRRL